MSADDMHISRYDFPIERNDQFLRKHSRREPEGFVIPVQHAARWVTIVTARRTDHGGVRGSGLVGHHGDERERARLGKEESGGSERDGAWRNSEAGLGREAGRGTVGQSECHRAQYRFAIATARCSSSALQALLGQTRETATSLRLSDRALLVTPRRAHASALHHGGVAHTSASSVACAATGPQDRGRTEQQSARSSQLDPRLLPPLGRLSVSSARP